MNKELQCTVERAMRLRGRLASGGPERERLLLVFSFVSTPTFLRTTILFTPKQYFSTAQMLTSMKGKKGRTPPWKEIAE